MISLLPNGNMAATTLTERDTLSSDRCPDQVREVEASSEHHHLWSIKAHQVAQWIAVHNEHICLFSDFQRAHVIEAEQFGCRSGRNLDHRSVVKPSSVININSRARLRMLSGK